MTNMGLDNRNPMILVVVGNGSWFSFLIVTIAGARYTFWTSDLKLVVSSKIIMRDKRITTVKFMDVRVKGDIGHQFKE